VRAIGIIPARMASTRFPGKPLAQIAGRPMLRRMVDIVSKTASIYPYYVATADPEIIAYCMAEKIDYIVTRSDCRSGTARCADAMRQLSNREGDIVVNIQGDEPLVRPESLDALTLSFNDPEVEVASLCFAPSNAAFSSDRNRVKVLVGDGGNALCFTRSMMAASLWQLYRQHVGVYAYRRDILNRIVNLPAVNDLEQLAWMLDGTAIRMVEIDYETVAVDSPADIAEVEKRIHG
jgi:3-deoxy-manno-octulosonate cytidylyltransferase (CMP-KDO synthetase)